MTIGPVPARFGYSPQIGKAGSSIAHPAVPPALAASQTGQPFTLFYPATGPVSDSLTLRNPSLGNKTRIGQSRISRESRGGTLIVFADQMWPVTETWVLSFAVLNRATGLSLMTFLANHIGLPIGMLDWQGRTTTGIVTDVGEGLVHDRRCSYSIGLTYEVLTTPETANLAGVNAIPTISAGLSGL